MAKPRANKSKTEAATPATSNAGPTKPTCLCGCGATPAGRRSEFVPGHDARLKQTLVVAAIGGDANAEHRLAERGWTHFLVAARERASKKQAKKDARKAAKAKPAPEKKTA